MCLLRASIIFCIVSSHHYLVNLQAPGNGDEYCLTLPSHPVYDSYIHPLMDARDYIQLLESGVWQTLDKDRIRNMSQYAWVN